MDQESPSSAAGRDGSPTVDVGAISECVLDAVAQLCEAPPGLLEQRLLQKRFESKYVVPVRHIPELLDRVSQTHAVLTADGERIARYRTDYFDTPDRRSFHDHRRGRPRRSKVRIRTYLDRDLTMLEIKHRSGNGQTIKHRVERADGRTPLTEEERAWILGELPWARQLDVSLQSKFQRVTLLGIDDIDRSTVDLAVRFREGDIVYGLGETAIVEVKTPRWRQHGPLVDALHALGHRPRSFSKYCVGSVLLEDNLPDIRFRQQLNRVRALGAGEVHETDAAGAPLAG